MQGRIAIVGAAGRMGSWFAKYFVMQNRQVILFDSDRQSLKQSPHTTVADDLKSCVEDADFVLVCVPVSLTPRVLAECGKLMKAGAVLAEISSIKRRTFPALSRAAKGIRPLCIHPMFGPGATVSSELRVLLVPVHDEDSELRLAAEYLPGTAISVIGSPEGHDNAMGLVLGLTYFVNLAFASVLAIEKSPPTRRVSGTTFRMQSMLSESILTDDPELIVALIRGNPFAQRHIRRYLKEAAAIQRGVAKPDSRELQRKVQRIKAGLESKSDLRKSYDQLYSAMLAINTQKQN